MSHLEPKEKPVLLDRDFLRGAFLQASNSNVVERKTAGRIRRLLRRDDGSMDLLAYAINTGQVEGNLTPVPDTGNWLIDRLTWFMENIDELLAFIEKIMEWWNKLQPIPVV